MSVSHEYDRERDCLTIRLEESFDFAVHKAFREAYAQLDAQPRTYVIDTSGTAMPQVQGAATGAMAAA